MLVALSNPRGVASLLDVAAHATEPETPAPRVLALVRGHRAESDRDFARRTRRCPRPRRFCSRQWIMRAVSVRKSKRCRDGPTIPARDIIQSALDISAGWILIGFHKPAFGTDGMGGTVRAVLERARTMPIHVGVVTRGEPEPGAQESAERREPHRRQMALHGCAPRPKRVQRDRADPGKARDRWQAAMNSYFRSMSLASPIASAA